MWYIVIAIAVVIFLWCNQGNWGTKTNQNSTPQSRTYNRTKNNPYKSANQDKPFTVEPPAPPFHGPGRSCQSMAAEYFQLTGVNIENEKKKWDERGKGYYGEYIVFAELFNNLSGSCKFLMNLQIPTPTGRTTEIDLLMVHETGIYVFEIKHYKGTIYGKSKEPTWTQYFRTASNNCFHNPILQNDYHIEALNYTLTNKGMLCTTQVPMYSVVVFTNEDVDISPLVNTRNDVLVTKKHRLISSLSEMISGPVRWNIATIDRIWNYLAQYSHIPTQEASATWEASVPLHIYIDALKFSHEAHERKLVILI